MKRIFFTLILALSIVGCSHPPKTYSTNHPSASELAVDDSVAPFSINPAGGLPNRWTPLVLFRTKKKTEYQLISEQNKTILHAYAPSASSGLMQYVSINPMTQPWINWKWRIGTQVETAGASVSATEDSPARIILGFDGDKDTLPFSDQILFETARVFTGYDFPYATLMYIWDSNTPVGTVLPSNRSGRIKMLVVANSEMGVGQWQNFNRNMVEDFEKAFGEKPGKLIGVGVLTDTDNMGQTVEAWYGDIRLHSARN